MEAELDMTDEVEIVDDAEDPKLETGLLPMEVKVPMAETVDCSGGGLV